MIEQLHKLQREQERLRLQEQILREAIRKDRERKKKEREEAARKAKEEEKEVLDLYL